MAIPDSAAAIENPLPRIKSWPIPQAYIMHSQYGRLDSCTAMQGAYAAAGWPSGISFETMQQIDRRLKSNVILRPDQGPDTWTPLAKTVIAAKTRPHADCDDVAITSAQLAICAGFPAKSIGLMITQLRSSADEMHLVAYYTDSSRAVWIFGDTMGRPRPLAQLGQKIHYFAQFDDVTTWWVVRDPANGRLLTQDLPTSTIPMAETPLDLTLGSCADTQP